MNTKTFTVQSRVLVAPPRARRIIAVLLDVVTILAVLVGVVRFVAGHDGLQLLSTGVIALLIQGGARSSANKIHYEPYLVDLVLSDSRWEIRCREKPNGMIQPRPVCFSVSELEKLEYSDRLQCYRLAFLHPVAEASNKIYHLLFVTGTEQEQLTPELERYSGLRVDFLDRRA